MLVQNSISGMRQLIAEQTKAGQIIGLVPTMGALHEGHLSLIDAAQKQCDYVVVSIFVNPLQFNKPEDLTAYPRMLAADLEKLKDKNVQLAFTPENETMYSTAHQLSISFGAMERVMEGQFRPGHFSGVGVVVSKLFNIVQPHYAYFGQKDFQQLTLIKKMVAEFMYPINIVEVPIVREANGLAMSSRNERLTAKERNQATIFYEALQMAQKLILEKQSADVVKQKIESLFTTSPAELEYFQIISADDLQPKTANLPNQDTVLCIAGYIGNVRLIDNLYLIS